MERSDQEAALIKQVAQSGEETWEVESIIGRRVHDGETQYLVKWKGYEVAESTWEKADACKGCASLVRRFNQQQKRKAMKRTALVKETEAIWKTKKRDFESPSPEDGNVEYGVEKVLGKRIRKGKIEYLLQWKNTWESEDRCDGSRSKIEDFEKAQRNGNSSSSKEVSKRPPYLAYIATHGCRVEVSDKAKIAIWCWQGSPNMAASTPIVSKPLSTICQQAFSELAGVVSEIDDPRVTYRTTKLPFSPYHYPPLNNMVGTPMVETAARRLSKREVEREESIKEEAADLERKEPAEMATSRPEPWAKDGSGACSLATNGNTNKEATMRTGRSSLESGMRGSGEAEAKNGVQILLEDDDDESGTTVEKYSRGKPEARIGGLASAEDKVICSRDDNAKGKLAVKPRPPRRRRQFGPLPRNFPKDVVFVSWIMEPGTLTAVHLANTAIPKHIEGVRIETVGPDHPCYQNGYLNRRLVATRDFSWGEEVGAGIGFCGELVHDGMRSASKYMAECDETVSIDAQRYGNELRFINSFKGIKPAPNTQFHWRFRSNGMPYLAIVCVASIRKGEEFLLNYGKPYDNAHLPKDIHSAPPLDSKADPKRKKDLAANLKEKLKAPAAVCISPGTTGAKSSNPNPSNGSSPAAPNTEEGGAEASGEESSSTSIKALTATEKKRLNRGGERKRRGRPVAGAESASSSPAAPKIAGKGVPVKIAKAGSKDGERWKGVKGRSAAKDSKRSGCGSGSKGGGGSHGRLILYKTSRPTTKGKPSSAKLKTGAAKSTAAKRKAGAAAKSAKSPVGLNKKRRQRNPMPSSAKRAGGGKKRRRL